MDTRLKQNLQGKHANYIIPLFWQRGEPDEVIAEEIEKIAESGIKAFCVESRPHDDFCGPDWWRTMDNIIRECKKRGMQVWIFDDKHFPTGYANGKIASKYPHLKKWHLTEKHMDVSGPQKSCSVLIAPCLRAEHQETIVSAVACKRSGSGEDLTGEYIKLTSCIKGDFICFDVPDGIWRVFVLIQTRGGAAGKAALSIDHLNPESVQVMINEIYEPHYNRYQEEFGRTIAGFFTDEPCFGNEPVAGFNTSVGSVDAAMPWNRDIIRLVAEKTGLDAEAMLPALWYHFGEKTKAFRVAYMDVVSELYSRNFGYGLGNWCREHGVLYIGHVLEDMNVSSKLGRGAGHYFRSLAGQDMSGIDVVYHQILPGFGDYCHSVFASSRNNDPEFYNFVLGKLGSSMAHLQKNKQGRALCEIFGAYGWAEGLPMMKWLADHMLVRGINYFVPHAFSPKYPDLDCPPHFYARGANPQFKYFKILMNYMNRLSHLFQNGVHIASAAIVYHAEAEWSGGRYMLEQKPAKKLAESQIDFDIVPFDSLLRDAEVAGRKLVINGEEYPCIIVPYAQYLPADCMKRLDEFAEHGVPVLFIDGMPDGVHCAEQMVCVELDELVNEMMQRKFYDVKLSKTYKDLRVYHYRRDRMDYYMFQNESIRETFTGDILLQNSGDYVIYDAMNNRVSKSFTGIGNRISVSLEPYQNLIIGFGMELDGVPDYEQKEYAYEQLNLKFRIEVSASGGQEPFGLYKLYKEDSSLININSYEHLQEFCGVIRYQAEFDFIGESQDTVIDLGIVGEIAEVSLNGIYAGEAICPPYRFPVGQMLRQGKNRLEIKVTNNPAYREKDRYSRFIALTPTGLLGPVKIGQKIHKV